MVYAYALGAYGETHESSNLSSPTIFMFFSGISAVVARSLWEREAGSSNLPSPTTFGC